MRLNARVPLAGFSSIPVHEPGALQTFAPEAELGRLVSCCLLGERQFYVDGADIEVRIRELAAQVEPERVADLALKARRDLGLRHAPLLLLVALAARGRGDLLRPAARTVLRTPRDAMDLLALYWRDGKRPLPRAFKDAFAAGFARWTDHQIAKYATLTNVSVRLRDLAFLSHPAPGGREALFRALADDALTAPDTWERAISRPGADKRAEWERLLREGKLGALALVRNLRNMEQAGVDPALVRDAMGKVRASDVWPWQLLAAAREAPAYTHDLDALMLRSCGALPRLPGKTGVLVDVSGSMDSGISERGTMRRMEAAAGLAVVLREVCERSVVASFSTEVAVVDEPMPRGARLASTIVGSQPHGGTALARSVQAFTAHVPDLHRLVVLTDEQAQDRFTAPIGLPVVVVNLASYQRGMNWQGPVARINGWSGGVVRWMADHFAGAAVAAETEGEDEPDPTH